MSTGLKWQAAEERKKETDEANREALRLQLAEIKAADVIEIVLPLVDNLVYVSIGKRKARAILKEYSTEITVLVLEMQDGMRIAELAKRGYYGKGPVEKSGDWKGSEAAKQQN